MKQWYRWTSFSMVDCPTGSCAILWVRGCSSIRCRYCYNLELLSNQCTDTTQDFRYKQIKNKIKNLVGTNSRTKKKFNKVDWIIITGGEALDTQHFFELVRIILYARKLGFKVGIYTNGVHPKKLFFLLYFNLIQYVNCDYKTLFCGYGDNLGENVRKSLQLIHKYRENIIFRINTTLTSKLIRVFVGLFGEIKNIFGFDIPIVWSDKPGNFTNCWQLTSVKNDVPTFSILSQEDLITIEHKDRIKKILNNVFFGKTIQND